MNDLDFFNISSIDSYLSVVSKIEKLSKEDEESLFVKYKEFDCYDSFKKIIIHHLGYVAYLAKDFVNYKIPLSDLIQEGNIGLIKSIKAFDHKKNNRLATYAVMWIKNEIFSYVLDNFSVSKIATTKPFRKLFFNLRKEKNKIRNEGWLTDSEANIIAENLDVKKSEVLTMEERLYSQSLSYEENPEEESDYFYYDQPYSEDFSLELEKTQIKDLKNESFNNALKSLNEREVDVLKSRYLNEDRKNLKEIAEQYSISTERVRQIESNAIKKMKSFIENSNLSDSF